MMLLKEPLCFSCQHFVMEMWNWHCAAFPEGIPDDIIIGTFDHHNPHEGDKGILFEPKTPSAQLSQKVAVVGKMGLGVANIGTETSGHHGHEGIPGHRGGSMPGSGGDDEPLIHIDNFSTAQKVENGKATHVSVTPKMREVADDHQRKVAEIVGGEDLNKTMRHNFCVDVGVEDTVFIEAKSMQVAKNDKFTIHPDSLRKKWNLLQTHPDGKVVFVGGDFRDNERDPKYYVSKYVVSKEGKFVVISDILTGEVYDKYNGINSCMKAMLANNPTIKKPVGSFRFKPGIGGQNLLYVSTNKMRSVMRGLL